MTTTTLLFRDVRAEHVKVSHGPFIGMPSITGITGLGRALCLQLTREWGLPPDALKLDASAFAYDQYFLHEGYKRGFKPGKADIEAIPAAFASMRVHLAFRVRARAPAAADRLAQAETRAVATEILEMLRLCKGNLRPQQRTAVNLNAPALVEHFPESTARLLAMLPSRARLLRSRAFLVEQARNEGLSLMELLAAASLRPGSRPEPYRSALDYPMNLVAVLNGFLYLQEQPSLAPQRIDAYGHLGLSHAVSATYTLAELQSVASARCHLQDEPDVFWRENATAAGLFNEGASLVDVCPETL